MTISLQFCATGDVVVPLPSYATPGSAGMDVRAALPESINLAPGERRLIPTGLRVAIPPQFELQVRPRSGLALKHGVTVLNSPGTIDSDFRGEIGVVLINHGSCAFTVEPLERIAQLVLASVACGEPIFVSELDETIRGSGGYGSTGKS